MINANLLAKEGNLQNHITLFMKGTKITNVNIVANHLLLTRGYSLNKHINAVHEGHKDFKCGSYDKSLHIEK